MLEESELPTMEEYFGSELIDNDENDKVGVENSCCGGGKTNALVNEIHGRLKKSCVLVLSPTKELGYQIESRLQEGNTDKREIRVINSDTVGETSTVSAVASHGIKQYNYTNAFERGRKDQENPVVICTHKAFLNIPNALLSEWVIVFDELPNLLDIEHWKFNISEMKTTVQNIIEVDKETKVAKLKITKEEAKVITSDASDALGNKLKSLVSRIAENGSEVKMFSKEVDEEKGASFHYNAFHENARQSMVNATEVHILAANFKDTLTALTLQHWGFKIQESSIKAKHKVHSNTDRITIYPLLPEGKRFSTSLINREYEGDHKELVADRLNMKVQGMLRDDFIYCYIKKMGANFSPKSNKATNVVEIPFDSRGKNDYFGFHKIAVLAHCNPNPVMSKNFTELENITSIPAREWRKAWDITNTYEMAYQLTARTSARMIDSTEPVEIIVPDMEYVKYLKEQFPDAVVDTDYAIYLPEQEDGRKTVKKTDKRRTPQSKKDLVIEKYKEGAATNTAIAKALGLAKTTVKNIIDEWSETWDYYYWCKDSYLILESVEEFFHQKRLQEEAELEESLIE
ncbi:MAG: hypothetical protein K6L76_02930 [Agarilytica sp.]